MDAIVEDHLSQPDQAVYDDNGAPVYRRKRPVHTQEYEEQQEDT